MMVPCERRRPTKQIIIHSRFSREGGCAPQHLSPRKKERFFSLACYSRVLHICWLFLRALALGAAANQVAIRRLLIIRSTGLGNC